MKKTIYIVCRWGVMDILYQRVQELMPDRFEMKYAKEFRDSRLVGEVSEEEWALIQLCLPELKRHYDE